MSNARAPNLLDLVAVLHCPAAGQIRVGDVGTVVEILPPDGAEVEFVGADGRTRLLATLSFSDLLVLNRERTAIA